MLPIDAGLENDGAGRTYWVLYQGIAASPQLASFLTPAMHSIYAFSAGFDPSAFLVQKSVSMPDPLNKQTLFRVRCVWETDGARESGGGGGGISGRGIANRRRRTHPLLRPVEIHDSSSLASSIAFVDRNGDPILNKAQMPFDPGVERADSVSTVTFTKNRMARLDGTTYNNRVNTDFFYGRAANKWKISDIQNSNEFEEWGENPSLTIEYWRTSVSAEYNANGWNPKKTLNAGRYELRTAFGQQFLRAITEGNKPGAPPVADPWPLSTTGEALDPADLPGAANYVESDLYDEIAFGQLGIF